MVSLQLVVGLCGLMMTTNVKQDSIVEYKSSERPKVVINDRDTYEFSVGGTAWANLSPSSSDVREPFELIQEKDLKIVTLHKCLNFSLKIISAGQDGNIKEKRTEYRCQPDEEPHVKPLVIGLSVGAVVLICLVGMFWMFRSSVRRPAPDPH